MSDALLTPSPTLQTFARLLLLLQFVALVIWKAASGDLPASPLARQMLSKAAAFWAAPQKRVVLGVLIGYVFWEAAETRGIRSIKKRSN